LKVRVRSGLLEVWGECTYAVKEELKKLKFRWDSDDGRKCWWQKVDDDQEEEKVKREVKKLADSRASLNPAPCNLNVKLNVCTGNAQSAIPKERGVDGASTASDTL
jgi:hypothetical protein